LGWPLELRYQRRSVRSCGVGGVCCSSVSAAGGRRRARSVAELEGDRRRSGWTRRGQHEGCAGWGAAFTAFSVSGGAAAAGRHFGASVVQLRNRHAFSLLLVVEYAG